MAQTFSYHYNVSSNEYMRQYILDRYYKRRSYWLDQLGGKCVICGRIDKLEFDHIDESKKEYDIGSILSSHSTDKIEYEMKKCQLLCERHHLEKTTKFNSVEHGEGLTGKKNCYCDLCAPLKRDYNYGKKYGGKQRKEKPPYICGSYRTYKHGCRCLECKSANSKYMQEFYIKNPRVRNK